MPGGCPQGSKGRLKIGFSTNVSWALLRTNALCLTTGLAQHTKKLKCEVWLHKSKMIKTRRTGGTDIYILHETYMFIPTRNILLQNEKHIFMTQMSAPHKTNSLPGGVHKQKLYGKRQTSFTQWYRHQLTLFIAENYHSCWWASCKSVKQLEPILV